MSICIKNEGRWGRASCPPSSTIIAIPLKIQWVAAQYRVQDNTLSGCRGYELYNPTSFFFETPQHIQPVTWCDLTGRTQSIFSSKTHVNADSSLSDKTRSNKLTVTKLYRQLQQQQTMLQFEPQPAPPVPHGAFTDPAGWRGPGDGGEGPAVDGHLRHLLFQRSQVATLHHPEHVQQEESRKHLANVTAVRRRHHNNTVNTGNRAVKKKKKNSTIRPVIN